MRGEETWGRKVGVGNKRMGKMERVGEKKINREMGPDQRNNGE